MKKKFGLVKYGFWFTIHSNIIKYDENKFSSTCQKLLAILSFTVSKLNILTVKVNH